MVDMIMNQMGESHTPEPGSQEVEEEEEEKEVGRCRLTSC